MLCPGPPWRWLTMINHGWSEEVGAIRVCPVPAIGDSDRYQGDSGGGI
jgi:hypothetical protein